MASAGTISVDFAAQTAQFQADIKRVQKSIDSVGSQFDAVGKIARTAFAAISFGAVTSQLTGLISKSLELGGAIADATKKAGISAEAFSELNFAAKLAGVGTDDLSSAFTKFQKELAGGGEKIASLGINLQRFKELQPDRQFEALAEAISAIQNPATRAGAAVEVFGKSGANLLPLFESGAKGIEMAREEANRLGITLSTSQAEALDAAGDKVDALKLKLDALSLTLTANLAKSIDFAAGKLQDFLSGPTQSQIELTTLTDQFDDTIKRRQQLLEEVQQLTQRKASTFVPGLNAEFDKAIAEANQQIRVTESLLNLLNDKIQRTNIEAERAAAEPPVPPGVVDPNARTFGTKAEEQAKELAKLNQDLQDAFSRNAMQLEEINAEFSERGVSRFIDTEARKTAAAISETQRRIEADIEAANFSERLAAEQAEREAAMRSQATDLAIDSFLAIGNANKKFAAIAKLANIAAAIRNTSEGITKALASAAPPYNFALAAVVGAAGAVQIANIRRTPDIGDRGGAPSFGGSAPTIGTQPTAPFNQTNSQELVAQEQPNAIQFFLSGPVFNSEETIRIIADAVKEATDRDIVVIARGSAQAQQFMPAQ